MSPTPIQVYKHDPERRRRPAVAVLHCGCSCCCCCCCLHALGGLLGAAVAPAIGPKSRLPITYYYDEDVQANVPSVRRPGPPAVLVFWWVFMALCALALPLSAVLMYQSGPAFGLIVSVILLLLALPLVQLVSVVIALVLVALIPRPDKGYQLLQLGKITLGVIAGSLLGILAMFIIGVALSTAMR